MYRLIKHNVSCPMLPGLLLSLVFFVGAPMASAQGVPPGTPQAQDASNPAAVSPGNAARGPSIYPTYEPDDDNGFVQIFDGKTMKDWDGDPTFWRAENGELIGETTPDKVVTLNNFLIWRGGKVKDFELKVEFKLGGTNSGIQYR